jgi:propionyl-CoA synthetase
MIPSAAIAPAFLQDELHALSLADPEAFWSHQASLLHWHKPPTAAVHTSTVTMIPPRNPNDDGEMRKKQSPQQHTAWSWFPGGEISTCYNCVDRHAATAEGAASPAIFYDSPVTGNRRTITYGTLLDEVAMLASVLWEEGVRKGDVVLVYSGWSLGKQVPKKTGPLMQGD